MTTAVPAPQQNRGSGLTSGLYDVLELILDRGLVIDVFVRVSVVGIELIKIDIRIVVASVDTYLRFAEACNRLDLEARKSPGLPDLVGGLVGGVLPQQSPAPQAVPATGQAAGDEQAGRPAERAAEDV